MTPTAAAALTNNAATRPFHSSATPMSRCKTFANMSCDGMRFPSNRLISCANTAGVLRNAISATWRSASVVGKKYLLAFSVKWKAPRPSIIPYERAEANRWINDPDFCELPRRLAITDLPTSVRVPPASLTARATSRAFSNEMTGNWGATVSNLSLISEARLA